jgi:hypothetical protein
MRHSLEAVVTLVVLALPGGAAAHDPEFTSTFDRDRCTFTTASGNPYLPLWPGYSLLLEGEEEDGGEIHELAVRITILSDTELVDGVITRVLEEREEEDGDLKEVSRNFVALCRETGDVWYFGEDVDNYEDGEIVNHDGAWRAGVNGAEPGVLMPGSPMVGARYFQEMAPGVALDRAEVTALDESVTTPAGAFDDVLTVDETNALDPSGEPDFKAHAPGVGQIIDETLELVEIEAPPCLPDAATHCLSDGRFEVRVEWADAMPRQGEGKAILASDDSGEFWFFNPNNTELIVKVLDACTLPPFNNFWVFAAGLTNVEVTLTVTDTETDEVRVYENPLGTPFAPILDTAAFDTCP